MVVPVATGCDPSLMRHHHFLGIAKKNDVGIDEVVVLDEETLVFTHGTVSLPMLQPLADDIISPQSGIGWEVEGVVIVGNDPERKITPGGS